MTAAGLLTHAATAKTSQTDTLKIAVAALSLQTKEPKSGKQGPGRIIDVRLAAKDSFAEPEAPKQCISPRIAASVKANSPAALQRQHSTPCTAGVTSKHARSKAAVQPLRKSADALPTKRTSNTVTSPLGQSRRQSSLSRSGGSTALSSEDARVAAIRRSKMRVEKIGINRDSAHERRRHEIYALNALMRASEEAKLQMLIKQHAESNMEADAAETERMHVLAAQPDSDDDKYDHRLGLSANHAGSPHKV